MVLESDKSGFVKNNRENQSGKVAVITSKFWGSNHDLVSRYGIPLSQGTTLMFTIISAYKGCSIHLASHLFCSWFMFYSCYLYLLFLTDVQPDFHIR